MDLRFMEDIRGIIEGIRKNLDIAWFMKSKNEVITNTTFGKLMQAQEPFERGVSAWLSRDFAVIKNTL